MKCSRCHTEQPGGARYCNNCGAEIADHAAPEEQTHKASVDELSVGMGLLCFLVFPVGFIIWITQRERLPKKAKNALILSSIALGIGLIGNIAALSSRANINSTPHNSEEPTQSLNTSVSSGTTSQSEWWEVNGTLHNASALQWQNATYANKLATCGDLMVTYWENGMLSEGISRDFNSGNMDYVRFWADSLVIVLDIAMERFPDAEENELVYANQKVSEIAALTLMMSNWINRN